MLLIYSHFVLNKSFRLLSIMGFKIFKNKPCTRLTAPHPRSKCGGDPCWLVLLLQPSAHPNTLAFWKACAVPQGRIT